MPSVFVMIEEKKIAIDMEKDGLHKRLAEINKQEKIEEIEESVEKE
jgi:hypothetical protein